MRPPRLADLVPVPSSTPPSRGEFNPGRMFVATCWPPRRPLRLALLPSSAGSSPSPGIASVGVRRTSCARACSGPLLTPSSPCRMPRMPERDRFGTARFASHPWVFSTTGVRSRSTAAASASGSASVCAPSRARRTRSSTKLFGTSCSCCSRRQRNTKQS
eukprot:scaffold271_cov252-Pinguiococcus_pyrenoidosus.AAC.13